MMRPKCPKCGDDDGVLLCGDCMFTGMATAEAAAPPMISAHLAALLRSARDHVLTDDELAAQKASFVRGMTLRCDHGRIDYEQCAACREEARIQQEARPVPDFDPGTRTGRQKCPSTKSA